MVHSIFNDGDPIHIKKNFFDVHKLIELHKF